MAFFSLSRTLTTSRAKLKWRFNNEHLSSLFGFNFNSNMHDCKYKNFRTFSRQKFVRGLHLVILIFALFTFFNRWLFLMVSRVKSGSVLMAGVPSSFVCPIRVPIPLWSGACRIVMAIYLSFFQSVHRYPATRNLDPPTCCDPTMPPQAMAVCVLHAPPTTRRVRPTRPSSPPPPNPRPSRRGPTNEPCNARRHRNGWKREVSSIIDPKQDDEFFGELMKFVVAASQNGRRTQPRVARPKRALWLNGGGGVATRRRRDTVGQEMIAAELIVLQIPSYDSAWIDRAPLWRWRQENAAWPLSPSAEISAYTTVCLDAASLMYTQCTPIGPRRGRSPYWWTSDVACGLWCPDPS